MPELGVKYVDVFRKTGVLPERLGLDGFVFYSPSANQGSIELSVARRLDEEVSGLNLRKKPKVIMADFFGLRKRATYKVGENPVEVMDFFPTFSRSTTNLENVVVERASAEAGNIPLESGSVDIIWDRLGALYHLIDDCRKSETDLKTEVSRLLAEYKRVLRPGGRLVVDASKDIYQAPYSTFAYATENSPGIDFPELGWDVKIAGEKETRIAILTPIPVLI
jgi:SAM-dependent methyltransferase